MRTLFAAAALALGAMAGALPAAEWPELSAQSSVPITPPAWRTEQPSHAVLDQWRGPEADRLVKLAADLEGFAIEHPEDPNVAAAREKESEALFAATRLGHLGAQSALGVLDRLRLSDPKLTEDARFTIRSRQVDESARLKTHESGEAGQAVFITGCRALTKEFPKRPEPWLMLIEMADQDNLEISRLLLDEARDGTTLPEVRTYAEAVRRRLDNLGKPFELHFTGLNGQPFDLSTLRGSVVLLFFWGSFSAPAMEQLPALQRLYEQHHGRKLEIVGINFDADPAQAAEFAKAHGLTWPQSCDGRGWLGEIPARYGVRAVPALWLVDRKGVLRDEKSATNLQDKIQLLLDEKE